MRSIRGWVCAAVAAFAAASPGAACAQADPGYPSRAVRFVVPIGPGSSGDTMTRLFAEQFRKVSGQPTVVENRPGADLVVGTQNVLASPPDGYSILLVSASAVVINPLVMKDLPYKVDDLTLLLGLMRTPAVLVTAAGSRLRTLGEFVDEARAKPASVTIGVYGNTYRLGAIDLGKRAGARFNLVSYKGASQAVADVVGGAADTALLDVGGAIPLLASGKIRALAIAGEARHAAIPSVPTFQEAGVAGYSLYAFIGFAVHAKTPAPIVTKLESLFARTVAAPELREQFAQLGGAELTGTGRQEFTQMVVAERERMRELSKDLGPEIAR